MLERETHAVRGDLIHRGNRKIKLSVLKVGSPVIGKFHNLKFHARRQPRRLCRSGRHKENPVIHTGNPETPLEACRIKNGGFQKLIHVREHSLCFCREFQGPRGGRKAPGTAGKERVAEKISESCERS